MSNFRVGNSRFIRFMNGKGFYIALALCLVAIGSAAYIASTKSFGVPNASSSKTESSVSGNNSTDSSFNWNGTDSAEQTNNTVSNVPANSSRQSASSRKTHTSSKSDTSKVQILFIMPVNGDIINPYSNGTPVYNKTFNDWRVHNGVDISGKLGTPVQASADGKVEDVKQDVILGTMVIIDHDNGIKTVYANLTTQVTVKKGQKLSAGDVIGCIGETAQGEGSLAPHLHFEMLKENKNVDPLKTINK